MSDTKKGFMYQLGILLQSFGRALNSTLWKFAAAMAAWVILIEPNIGKIAEVLIRDPDSIVIPAMFFMLFVSVALRTANIVRATQHQSHAMIAPMGTGKSGFSTGKAILASGVGNSPMPEEWDSVSKKYGSEVAEIAVAMSSPGDSIETVMMHASTFQQRAVKEVSTPLTVARHEAAHAVVAKSCGQLVISATALRAIGMVKTMAPLTMPRQDQLFKELILTLAGNSIDQLEGTTNSHSHEDMNDVTTKTHGIISIGIRPTGYRGEMASDQIIAAAKLMSADAIRDNMDHIDNVAIELLEHKTLNSHQLRDLLSDVKPLGVLQG